MFLHTVKSVVLNFESKIHIESYLNSCQPHRNPPNLDLLSTTLQDSPIPRSEVLAMINNEFSAAMTSEEFLAAETRHVSAEQSRKLAMAAGLTKSSDELKEAWEADPETYMVTLKGAIEAYEENRSMEEILVSALARLASVVDRDDDVIERALEIVSAGACRTSIT